jgi:hypothetical protein
MMQGPFNAAQADANDAFLERQRADIDRTRLNVIRYRRQRDYHASLKQKYLLASCRPWLPVAPDPPEPE